MIDKVPIFVAEPLDGASSYPHPGGVRCEVVALWRDSDGRELARVNTARPDGVETVEGLFEFVVRSDQLSND